MVFCFMGLTKKEFYTMYEPNEIIGMIHCNQLVEGIPHYRDNPDENDYIVCPICGEKLYIAE